MEACARSITPVIAFGVMALAAGAIGLLCPSHVQAQSSIPREETWVTNGSVNAIARTANTVYIGGAFTDDNPRDRTL